VKEKHSSNPLKRFGTVLGRRRQSTHPYGRASSPERKSSSNLGSAFSGFGKGKSKDREAPGPSDRPTSPLRQLPETPRSPEPLASSNHSRLPSTENQSGSISEVPFDTSPAAVNGTVHDSIPELREPLEPPPVEETKAEVRGTIYTHAAELTSAQPEKDAEGFSVPPSTIDAITEAEREAGL
jgi:hypothetical protein